MSDSIFFKNSRNINDVLIYFTFKRNSRGVAVYYTDYLKDFIELLNID
jgi:hypothetical protein